MPPNSDALAQTAAIRSQLQADVQTALATFRHHLTLVIQTNPATADPRDLLDRPDVAEALEHALSSAHNAASSAVAKAGGQDSQYLQSIAADVDALYHDATAQVRSVASRAFSSVPQPPAFVPGVDQPGTSPVVESGQERAAAVGSALTHLASDIALRNGLSVNVAGSRAHAESVTQEARRRYEAGEDIWLEWRSQLIPDVTCPWCWRLHGQRVRPGQQFPHPSQIGRRKPPRIWGGMLHGPPLHPNCRCWLVIVTGSGAEAPEEPAPEPPAEQFISSTDIAAMPEEKYHGLLAFLRAALHELGQMLRRLVSGG